MTHAHQGGQPDPSIWLIRRELNSHCFVSASWLPLAGRTLEIKCPRHMRENEMGSNALTPKGRVDEVRS